MSNAPAVETVLLALGDEVSLCHFRINALLEAIHGGSAGGSTPSRRAALRNLADRGAMTVPRMAALRPVTRQYMQTVVNDLLRDSLVELAPNPAHRS
ncbi:MAG: helix-turn-helix domain-containing protein [Proteobacteria bacterium]|nr:helix-turn-helix domain-containing protein [Pseudomonadota bacterium]